MYLDSGDIFVCFVQNFKLRWTKMNGRAVTVLYRGVTPIHLSLSLQVWPYELTLLQKTKKKWRQQYNLSTFPCKTAMLTQAIASECFVKFPLRSFPTFIPLF